jgi:pimeloyl-ACP methyl ester carboxylesterase
MAVPFPPVVLVHGFASSYEHGWARHGWPDLLADAGRTVVGVDLLGHGSSPRPHDPGAYDAVEDLVAAEFPADSQVDAVGFSAGALVLLRLAVRDPARFRRIVLLGVGDGLLHEPDPTPLVAAIQDGPTDGDLNGAVFRRLADSPGNDRQALVAFLSRPAATLTDRELAKVDCPVLIIVGQEDAACPATRLAGSLADGTAVVLPGLDHFATPSDFRVIDQALAFISALGGPG